MADTKKVTVFVGSAHKRGATWRAARVFLDGLERYGDVRGEIVVLSDFHLGVCRGCKACTNHGEERCPLRDDRDELIEKMMSSDGVVFASPNYSFQVSAIMKIFSIDWHSCSIVPASTAGPSAPSSSRRSAGAARS